MNLYIKYMVSLRCKMMVKEELKKLGLHFVIVDLGTLEILEDITQKQHDQLKKNLLKSGLELNTLPNHVDPKNNVNPKGCLL